MRLDPYQLDYAPPEDALTPKAAYMAMAIVAALAVVLYAVGLVISHWAG